MNRRGFIFTLLLAAVFLLTAGYFFLTGSFFLTKILFPWISRAAGTEITVRHATLRIFSGRIILHDFRMGIPENPLLTVRRARGTLLFLPLLRGRLEFSNVELSQAKLKIVRNASGEWCRQELGEAFFQDGDDGNSGTETRFRLCLHQVLAEDSAIEIVRTNRQQRFRIMYSDFNGAAENYQNGGTMILKCCARVRADGIPGMDIRSEAEWNGELDWGTDFSLTGTHGILDLPQVTGQLDGTRLSGSGLRCTIHAHRPKNELWEIRHLQLLRQNLYSTSDMVELSGHCRQNPLDYSLNIQRGEISGALFSIFSEIIRNIRPGEMRLNVSGKLSGTSEQFCSTLNGHVERQAGPARFSGKEIMLPDFRLTMAHDIGFNWQTRRITVKKLDTELVSGEKTRLWTALQKDQILHGKINDLSVHLLRLLQPELNGVIPADGSLHGKILLKITHGQLADTLSGHAALDWKHAALRKQDWQSRFFDAGLSAKMTLPLASGLLKFSPLQLQIDQGKTCQVRLEGSIPLRDDRTRMTWDLKGDPEKLLPILNQETVQGFLPVLHQFAPLQLTGSGKLDFSPGEMQLHEQHLTAEGKAGSRITVSLAERKHLFGAGDHAPWNWSFSAAVPFGPRQFRHGELALDRGKCRFDGTFDHSTGLTDWQLNSSASWQELAGTLSGHAFNDAGGGAELSLHGNGAGEFALSRGNLFFRIHGTPALRLENSGSGNLAQGEFSGSTTIRYANKDLLNLLLPWSLSDGQCSGNIRTEINLDRKDYRFQASTRMRRLSAAGLEQPVNGEFSCEYRHQAGITRVPQCRLNLEQEDGSRIADLLLELRKGGSKSAPVQLQLTSREINMDKLSTMFSGTAGSSASRFAPHTAVDWGPQRTRLDLQLKNIYWNKRDPMSLAGTVFLQRSRITIPQLIFTAGGGKLAMNANGMDFPTGMLLNISGKLLSPMQIRPLTGLCWPESGLSGIVQEGTFKLTFRRLYTASWSEDLTGKCSLRFRDLELPADAANGPLSRTLLFPVEAMMRAEKVIPRTMDVTKHFQDLWQQKFDPQSPFAVMRFSRGELQLQADSGRVNIQKMDFTGEPVTQLNVAGHIGMNEPYEIKLDFDAAVCGVRVRIPVRGTMDVGKVQTWQIFGTLPGANLASWCNMLGLSDASNAVPRHRIASPLTRILQDLQKLNPSERRRNTGVSPK